jgi:hypothetical protein
LYNKSSNWISSVTRSSTGTYAANIESGVFSSTPQCYITPGRASGSGDIIAKKSSSNSSTVYNIITFGVGGGVNDSFFDLICFGPRGSL